MTTEQIKAFIREELGSFYYNCGAVGNSHLSQCDYNEVAKPIATQAFMNGLERCDTNGSYGHTLYMVESSYLTALAYVVRAEKLDNFVDDQMHAIYNAYWRIRHYALEEDDFSYELSVAINELKGELGL